jgi:dihydropteroate synthase
MLFKDRTVIFNNAKVMGILNVTPDSFSDGGKFNTLEKALEQARQMVKHGATFIDVGGESTRPGALEVSLDEELSRVIPVIEAIDKELDVIVSIDTSKAQVMREAVKAGARLINDVRALQLPNALEMAAVLSQQENIPVCIMHMQNNPSTMQIAPHYDSVVDEVIYFFRVQIERLIKAGYQYNQILLDPGFGFGKSLDHNYQLLQSLMQFTQFDMPLLVGMSRKSMIGNLLNKEVDERLWGDIAANTIAAMSGASILRVHDVKETMDAVKIVDKTNSVKKC